MVDASSYICNKKELDDMTQAWSACSYHCDTARRAQLSCGKGTNAYRDFYATH